jgi:hypothetical protein
MISRLRLIWLVAFCAITIASVSAQSQNLDDIRHKAEAGDANAQFHLAQAYIEGKDIAKDPAQGLAWLRKSADQGYFGAEYALAYMYLNGAEKLQKDQHEAAKWFLKAAKQQNKAAQDKLAAMFAQGLISEQEANWRAGPKASPTVARVPKEAKKGKAAPFSFGEVETGLAGGITSKRMTTLVQKFGVDFNLSPVTRKRLANEGADDNLLTTISASSRSL